VLIGERALDVSPGLANNKKVANGKELQSIESTDLLTLISGKKMGIYLASLGEMASQLNTIAMALLDKNRTQNLVQLIDSMEPLVKNLNHMSIEVTRLSQQATQNDHLNIVLNETAKTARALNEFLPELQHNGPTLAKNIDMLVANLSQLTEQMKMIIPTMADMAPELPRVSRRAVEALDESVVLMKAIQKSMLLKGNVEEVREEEAKDRQPANVPNNTSGK
jgi:phospholipid/cholesterol/gamma-HCH transport system substrate-binding protein